MNHSATMVLSTNLSAPTTTGGEQSAEGAALQSPPGSRQARAPPPEVLMMILERIPHKFDRWQTAAALALAGAFGTGSRSYLEPFWLEEAQRPGGPGISQHTAPFNTAASIQIAAITMGLITRNTAVLTDAQAVALSQYVPQSVPLTIVQEMRRELYRRHVLSTLEAEGLGAFSTHRSVLTHLNFTIPDWTTLLARLRREQELNAALAPYGLDSQSAGIEGWRDRPSVRNICFSYVEYGIGTLADIVATLTEPVRRKAELSAALAARGLELDEHHPLCRRYIQDGEYTAAIVTNELDEDRFFSNYTDYINIYEEIVMERAPEDDDHWWITMSEGYTPEGGPDVAKMQENAREQAWQSVVRSRGRESLLALLELPPLLRQRLEKEGEGVKKKAKNNATGKNAKG